VHRGEGYAATFTVRADEEGAGTGCPLRLRSATCSSLASRMRSIASSAVWPRRRSQVSPARTHRTRIRLSRRSPRRSSTAPLPDASLLHDARERTPGNLHPGSSGDGHRTGFHELTVLPMAASRADPAPAVRLQEQDQIPDDQFARMQRASPERTFAMGDGIGYWDEGLRPGAGVHAHACSPPPRAAHPSAPTVHPVTEAGRARR
jgi:hypothetical protein